mmetsp:Transcript_24133/g.51242  ORF Transcript_24133/g.51242 Transcript_24133/m.51242 type:complete len:272 (-) Transcript_24133:93-908(-)
MGLQEPEGRRKGHQGLLEGEPNRSFCYDENSRRPERERGPAPPRVQPRGTRSGIRRSSHDALPGRLGGINFVEEGPPGRMAGARGHLQDGRGADHRDQSLLLQAHPRHFVRGDRDALHQPGGIPRRFAGRRRGDRYLQRFRNHLHVLLAAVRPVHVRSGRFVGPRRPGERDRDGIPAHKQHQQQGGGWRRRRCRNGQPGSPEIHRTTRFSGHSQEQHHVAHCFEPADIRFRTFRCTHGAPGSCYQTRSGSRRLRCSRNSSTFVQIKSRNTD